MSILKKIYVLLGMGVFLSFFGHGMFAVTGKDKFGELVSGSFDALGVTVSQGDALTMVRFVGWVDLLVTVVIGLLIVAMVRGSKFALGPVAIAVYSWAVVWGFMTAAARPFHSGGLSGFGTLEFFDLVERGPNFILPAALLVLVFHMRRSADA